MWTVFDEETRLAAPLAMTREQFAGGWLKQVERYTSSQDNSAEIEAGWIARADTVRELAEKLEVDPEGLEQEVTRFNADHGHGEDSRFGRPAAAMAPIQRPPFYGYRFAGRRVAAEQPATREHATA
jgi:hypothetical protein